MFENLFIYLDDTGPPSPVTYEGVTFLNAGPGTSWFDSATSLANVTFRYCTGIYSGTTNMGAKIQFCTDENGNALPNQ